MFNYFYKITNKVNGNFYFGVHRTKILEDGYMGSGKRLRYAIEKYGIENFTKEIIEFFDTSDEALDFESEIVTEKLVLDKNCYNLIKGGMGGWDYVNKNRKNSEFYKSGRMKEHLSNIGKWQDKEKRLKILNSIPIEKRRIIGKKMGLEFGGQNKLNIKEIEKRLNLIKDVDLTKWGWVSIVSKKLNLSHTQTKRFIDEYYKGKIYRRKL